MTCNTPRTGDLEMPGGAWTPSHPPAGVKAGIQDALGVVQQERSAEMSHWKNWLMRADHQYQTCEVASKVISGEHE